MVKDGFNGFLCNDINASSLAKTIKKAVNTEFNRDSIVTDAKERFSLEKLANSYIELYRGLV